jgi:hypothetical protein
VSEPIVPQSELCLPTAPGGVVPPSGESTSAALRRVEQELADAREELSVLRDAVPCGWCDGLGVAPAERFGRDPDGAPMVEEDGPCPEGCEIPAWLRIERDEAQDALVEVQAEMDERRAERDAARSALKTVGEQRDQARAELESARTELALIRRQRDTLRADLDRARNRAEAAERALTYRGEKSMTENTGGEGGSNAAADGIVSTVTPTIMDGTVVRWYRSEIAAETHRVMVSASRNGISVGEHLTNGEVTPGVMERAELVHELLRRKPDADLSGWATHRRERTFGGGLVRVGIPAAAVTPPGDDGRGTTGGTTRVGSR